MASGSLIFKKWGKFDSAFTLPKRQQGIRALTNTLNISKHTGPNSKLLANDPANPRNPHLHEIWIALI
jgi:hypothetical protein